MTNIALECRFEKYPQEDFEDDVSENRGFVREKNLHYGKKHIGFGVRGTA